MRVLTCTMQCSRFFGGSWWDSQHYENIGCADLGIVRSRCHVPGIARLFVGMRSRCYIPGIVRQFLGIFYACLSAPFPKRVGKFPGMCRSQGIARMGWTKMSEFLGICTRIPVNCVFPTKRFTASFNLGNLRRFPAFFRSRDCT